MYMLHLPLHCLPERCWGMFVWKGGMGVIVVAWASPGTHADKSGARSLCRSQTRAPGKPTESRGSKYFCSAP